MTCRSTAGGRAASSCATALSGGSADDASRLLHELRAFHATQAPDAATPTADDVLNALTRLADRVRAADHLTESRRGQALSRVNEAVAAVCRGDPLPDAATLTAWQDLPAAMTAERLLNSINRGTARGAAPTAWDVPVTKPGTPQHKKFRQHNIDALTATRALFDARPARLDLTQAQKVIEEWLTSMSVAYRVPVPVFAWDPHAADAGGGIYTTADRLIRLSHVSVARLLHEYRHHLQYNSAPMCSADMEEDAEAWALSLYAVTRPKQFARLVANGQIVLPGNKKRGL